MGTASARSALVIVACLLAVTAVGAPHVAAQQSADTPVVEVGTERVDLGDRTLVPISLSAAPDGLSGYELTAPVDDGSVAPVRGGEYARPFNVTAPPETSGEAVTLEAVDSDDEITPGSADVVLGYVAVEGESAGRVTLDANVQKMHDDEGEDVAPLTQAGQLEVRTNSEGEDDDGFADGAGSDDGTSDGAATSDEGEYTDTHTEPEVATAEGIVTPQVGDGDGDAGQADGPGQPPESTPETPKNSGVPVAPILFATLAVLTAGAVGLRAVIQ